MGQVPSWTPGSPFQGEDKPPALVRGRETPWPEAGRALRCGGTEPGHNSCRGDPHSRLSSRGGIILPRRGQSHSNPQGQGG